MRETSLNMNRDKAVSIASRINTIVPAKDIVGGSAYAFEQTLFKMIKAGKTEISIDLSSVREIDALGVEILITVRNLIKSQNGSFKIVNISAHLTQLFIKMEIYDFLNVQGHQTVYDSIAVDVLSLPLG